MRELDLLVFRIQDVTKYHSPITKPVYLSLNLLCSDFLSIFPSNLLRTPTWESYLGRSMRMNVGYSREWSARIVGTFLELLVYLFYTGWNTYG